MDESPAPVALPPITFAKLPRPWSVENALALFDDNRSLRLSVVLPACNEQRTLQRTFEQLLGTLPARSEVLIVDNGSTDGCTDFLPGAARQPADCRSRLLASADWPVEVEVQLLKYPEPLGVVGARNAGLRQTRGEVIVSLDANVDLPPGWWPPVVAVLRQPGVGLVGPALTKIGEPEQGKVGGMRLFEAKLDVQWLRCRTEDPYPVPVIPGTVQAFRREVLEAVGGFDDGFRQRGAEDVELCLRMWLLGYEVWVVPEVEVAHLYRPASPYSVDWTVVLGNMLRVGLLHVTGERLARFLQAWQTQRDFAQAMAMCVESDVGGRRAELLARRRYDDDWFFSHPYFRELHAGL